MNYRPIRDNALLQYTIISFVLTVVLASILSWFVSLQMKNQLLYSHGDFYRAFMDVIESNYSEIIPLITDEEYVDISDHVDQEHVDEHSEGDDAGWSHFESDLFQFPFVTQVRVSDVQGDTVWMSQSKTMSIIQQGISNVIKLGDGSLEEYTIFRVGDMLAVEYKMPISVHEKPLGFAYLLDIDPGLETKILSTQIKAVSLIFIGGLIFYLSLFLLYFRVHKKQAMAISQLEESQSITIETMSRLAELKDDNTGAHIRRTSLYCRELVLELKKLGKYSSYLTKIYIRDLERSAPLHDIGKVGVPDSILQKPGPLTEEEFDIIKTHPHMGAKVLLNASEKLEFQSFFEIGYQIVLHHHENWDGSGYPNGLIGEDIPLSARIMSIADVYDALTTDRPYKHAFSHEEALDIILKGRGSKFDPLLIDALLNVSDQFKKISLEFAD